MAIGDFGGVKIEESWGEILKNEFEKPYFAEIRSKYHAAVLRAKTKDSMILPPPNLTFAAFNATRFSAVKVVILGQDPYFSLHNGVPLANGLCFSVPKGVPLPPSLKNIFKEIRRDLGESAANLAPPSAPKTAPQPSQPLQPSAFAPAQPQTSPQNIPPASAPSQKPQPPPSQKSSPPNGDLGAWAAQGVLLLNAILSTELGCALSHKDFGWENLTNAAISALSTRRENLVFMLWGNFARAKKSLIDQRRHLVLEAPHPSPLARRFIGCGHFGKCNEYLRKHGIGEVDWRMD